MIQKGFAISPGTENFVAVTPSTIYAEEEIHGMSHEERGCYLDEEQELAYFRHYSFLNCFMELSANFTAEVPFLKKIRQIKLFNRNIFCVRRCVAASPITCHATPQISPSARQRSSNASTGRRLSCKNLPMNKTTRRESPVDPAARTAR